MSIFSNRLYRRLTESNHEGVGSSRWVSRKAGSVQAKRGAFSLVAASASRRGVARIVRCSGRQPCDFGCHVAESTSTVPQLDQRKVRGCRFGPLPLCITSRFRSGPSGLHRTRLKPRRLAQTLGGIMKMTRCNYLGRSMLGSWHLQQALSALRFFLKRRL